MAQKRQITEQTEQAVKVCCCDCLFFQRDTGGRSRSMETGEYFMGKCGISQIPDVPSGRIFANKRRICQVWRAKE